MMNERSSDSYRSDLLSHIIILGYIKYSTWGEHNMRSTFFVTSHLYRLSGVGSCSRDLRNYRCSGFSIKNGCCKVITYTVSFGFDSKQRICLRNV